MVAPVVIALVLYATAFSRVPAAVRAIAWFLLLPFYLLWVYVAATLAAALAWAMPWPVRGLVLVLGLGWGFTLLSRRWRRLRVPLALPLGVWIVAGLLGWLREEWVVRCDDWQRVTAQGNVRIAVASSDKLQTCRPGARIGLKRYPRLMWQSPDDGRVVFSTQGSHYELFRPPALEDVFDGSVCEARLDGGGRPHCVETVRAHGITDGSPLDRLFAVGGLEGRGQVVALSRTGPLRVLQSVPLHRRGLIGDSVYDPASDTLWVGWDDGREAHLVRGSDLRTLGTVPMHAIAGRIHYDPQRREGVKCFGSGPFWPHEGRAYLALAFRESPAAVRALGSSARHPFAWLALSWGCDWDPAERSVYASIPTLGLLVRMSYDSGAVAFRRFVGFDIRPVAVDRARGRVYVGEFFGGTVHALDAATGREVARWFVGRYVRDLQVSRDGAALLAASNVGIVGIRL
jgi:hypothetical protein